MAAQGVSTFVEIGPGRVLGGLIKRIATGATIRNINAAGSMTS
jgi:malonyl CoA-acyl carrier protein transacylase